MTTVVVGKGEKKDTFVIAEPLLASASPYFRNALKDTFKEGQNDRIELEEESPTVFGLLNEYLHQGSIDETFSTDDYSEDPRSYDSVAPTMPSYCSLWCLAHYLQIESLMDYSMLRLLETVDRVDTLSLYTIEHIYDEAPMESILRKFLVHLCVWSLEGELKPSEEAPQDLLRDLVTEFQKKCDPKEKNPLMDVRNYYVAEKKP